MKHCPKCGKELLDEAVICTGCGCAVGGTDSKPKKKSSGKKILLIVLVVVAAVFCVIGYLEVIVPNRYIKMVKNGAPDSFPGVTWGEAVDKVLDNPVWSYKGDNVVEVTGNTSVGACTITFAVNTSTNRFNVTSIELAGEKYTSAVDLGVLITTIFGY